MMYTYSPIVGHHHVIFRLKILSNSRDTQITFIYIIRNKYYLLANLFKNI